MSTVTQADNAAYNNFNKRSFWALFAAMAQAAFNDNILKFVILYFLMDQAKHAEMYLFDIHWSWLRLNEKTLNGIGTVVFSLPFIIFAGAVGALCDRFSKRTIAITTKVLEIFIGATLFIVFDGSNVGFLLGVIFLMAAHSTLFGPAKFGLLPETLPESRLSWANGMFAMGTLGAVIVGTGLAGFLYEKLGENVHFAAIFLVIFSGIGLLCALNIQQVPAANPAQRIPLMPWGGLEKAFRAIWRDKQLLHTFVGYVYFWFAGILMLQNITVLTDQDPTLSDATRKSFNSLCLAFTTLGIGIGSVVAGLASRRKIELGLVPIGIFGMSFFALLLSILADNHALLVVMIFAMGFFAGFFDVPLAATVQKRSPKDVRGGIMAAGNMLTFIGMLIGGGMFILFGILDTSPKTIFLLTALFSITLGVYMCWKLPIIVLRAIMWVLTNTRYRIDVLGRSNIPEDGPALYLSNHYSIVDTLFILCSTDRQIHFIVGPGATRVPWAARIARVTHALVYDPDAPAAERDTQLAAIRQVLADGHVVCLSTEGPHHADGTLADIHHNYKLITGDRDVPIHPIAVTRMWGVVYDIINGDTLRWRKLPFKPYRIAVNFGAALTDTAPEAARRALDELGVATYHERRYPWRVLHHGFIKAARRRLRHMAFADPLSGELSYFKALVGSIAFARKLRVLLDQQEMVGVLVPPSVGGALANIALNMLGRVPVNLNYTASNETLASCTRQCKITQVLTSKKLLERLPIEVPGTAVFLEDIKRDRHLQGPHHRDALCASSPRFPSSKNPSVPPSAASTTSPRSSSPAAARASPRASCSRSATSFPTACRSTRPSPTTKRPASSASYPSSTASATPSPSGSLPSGASAPSITPIRWSPKSSAALSRKYKATIMIGTSTFLQHFIRRCTKEQLQSLEFVVCGAEKLSPRVRDAFQEKFGVEPLEGYGTTECAPGVSVNAPDLVSPGMHAKMLRRGTIGRAFPGQMPCASSIPTPRPGTALRHPGPPAGQGPEHHEAATSTWRPRPPRSFRTAGTAPAISPPSTSRASSRSPTDSPASARSPGRWCPTPKWRRPCMISSGSPSNPSPSPACRTRKRASASSCCTSLKTAPSMSSSRSSIAPACPTSGFPAPVASTASRSSPSSQRARWTSRPSRSSPWNSTPRAERY
jgi:acyl-[acyl-carrier-protein]-phospholipid O-acyltransferase/long-chain-fatty-acid--[acyl-carrier-protein] ligase